MTLNIFTDIGEWFKNIFEKIGKFFEPMTNWFNEVTEPVKNFILDNTRNPIFWIAIILIGLIVFELTYKALSKK